MEVLVSEYPENEDYMGLLGVIAARLGDREKALKISGQLGAMARPKLLDLNTQYRVRIAAVLGEPAEAVRLLQDALRKAWLNPPWFRVEVDFESLRDYPPFQELMRPKG